MKEIPKIVENMASKFESGETDDLLVLLLHKKKHTVEATELQLSSTLSEGGMCSVQPGGRMTFLSFHLPHSENPCVVLVSIRCHS